MKIDTHVLIMLKKLSPEIELLEERIKRQDFDGASILRDELISKVKAILGVVCKHCGQVIPEANP